MAMAVQTHQIVTNGGRAPRPIWYVHIQKTAGTTLFKLLNRHVDQKHAFTFTSIDELVRNPPRLSDIDLVYGHFGLALQEFWSAEGIRPLKIALVRDPVARTISEWSWLRQHARSSGWHTELADLVEQDFGDAIREPRLDRSPAFYRTPNLQSRWISSEVTASRIPNGAPCFDGKLVDSFGKQLFRDVDDSELLGQAMEAGAGFDLIAPDWAAYAVYKEVCRLEGWQAFAPPERTQRSERDFEVAQEDLELLVERNRVDSALSAWVLENWMRSTATPTPDVAVAAVMDQGVSVDAERTLGIVSRLRNWWKGSP